jgi:putative nucleotidyltransferase with HDIG domain
MNNRAWRGPLAMGAVTLLAVWANDLAVALVRGGEYWSAGYAVHLTLFVALAVCTAYLGLKLTAANSSLETCRAAFRGMPCALAVVRRGVVAELCGNDSLLKLAGLAEGKVYGPGAQGVRTEEYAGPDGTARVVERRTVPLKGCGAGAVTAELLYEVSDSVRQARAREDQYMRMLKILVNMFEMKDPYSNGHSDAVSNLAHDLAKAMGMSAPAVETVARAALLHDIGKIIVPAAILNKDGELTPEEYRTVQAHAAVGADILVSFDIFREEEALVRHHHERFDGRGYPDGLKGGEIPLGARIMAVADAFDAMTSGRSVRGRRDVAAALAVIEAGKGGQFDPAVAEAFVALVRAGRAGKENEVR